MDSPKTVAERIVAEWPCDHDEISADDWRTLKSSIAAALRARDEAHAEEVKRLKEVHAAEVGRLREAAYPAANRTPPAKEAP